MDGVLFDTERLARENWMSVSRELGWPQVGARYLEFVGQNRADIQRRMLELWGPEFPQEAFFQACSRRSHARVEAEGLPLKPGVREILDFLRDRRVPTALATSTSEARTHWRMARTGLAPYFQSITAGDQVAHSKPDPEIYRLACRRLGADPARALAVEDSRNGILSASAAGMQVVMIPDLIPPTPELERLLLWRLGSLLELRARLAEVLPQ